MMQGFKTFLITTALAVVALVLCAVSGVLSDFLVLLSLGASIGKPWAVQASGVCCCAELLAILAMVIIIARSRNGK